MLYVWCHLGTGGLLLTKSDFLCNALIIITKKLSPPSPAENCTYKEFWGILRLLLSVLLWVLFVVYGNWQPWSTWSSCSSTCGHGTMTRTRHCDTEPTHPCQGQSSEEYTCNNAPCGESNCCASFVSSTSSPMGLNYVF